jgi:hypothetical protein
MLAMDEGQASACAQPAPTALLRSWRAAVTHPLSGSMQLGRAGEHLPTRGALLLSRTQASVAEFRRQTLAPDELRARRP